MEWQDWQEQIGAKDLPWFAREKLRNGSFATFAGVRFASDPSGEWEACSYGDACLFVVRNDAVLLSSPITSSEAFNNNPPLLATLADVVPEHVRIVTGIAEPGDIFYLATDALAQWFLAQTERGEKPWIAFDTGILTDADLQSFVAEYREQKSEERRRNPSVDCPAGSGMSDWPGSDHYTNAIQSPSTCFRDADLRHASVEWNKRTRMPKVYTGNFAQVYELRNSSSRWAVKCSPVLPLIFAADILRLHKRLRQHAYPISSTSSFLKPNPCQWEALPDCEDGMDRRAVSRQVR